MIDRRDAVEDAYFQSLLDLFSVVMVLDRQLKVVFASETLLRYMPELSENPEFYGAFNLIRPRALQAYEDFIKRLDSLYLMTSIEENFAVRGQFIHGTEKGRDYLVFCGAPWLHWMNSNRPELKLGLKDFSHQDVQLDQLLYMATESNMVGDLERLNSELVQAKEDVERAQAARNAFFAQMSHEMRTPLNGVMSALALIERESLQSRSQELVSLAQKSSRTMLQVINYVLDIAKLESLDIGADEEEFDLSHLVESVIDVVRPRAMEKKLDLRFSQNAVLPSYYRGDSTTLRHVLLNLLINAIKFTERGGVSVDVDTPRSDGMSVRIEVADTGIGIEADAQATIFEAFTTVGDSAAPLGEGSGLGLDIARRSVEALGGSIGVISSPGEGSRFWIELPLSVVSTVEKSPLPSQAVSAESRFRGHVLLVDDNETNLTLMGMILENLGVTVTCASSGESAIDKVEQGDFDLVLMDISMPGIDGYEATHRIREHRDGATLPVIALSAYTGAVERDQSKASGMNDYLTKPVEQADLIVVLERYLGTEHAEEEGADANAVDMDVLLRLKQQIGPENLFSVIQKFNAESVRRWSAIGGATSSEELAREAHTLASTCRSFGLPGVADELNAIEEHAKAGGVVEGWDNLAATGERLSRQVAELTKAVSGLTGTTG